MVELYIWLNYIYSQVNNRVFKDNTGASTLLSAMVSLFSLSLFIVLTPYSGRK